MGKILPQKNISVFGLGKLGACYAAFSADNGIKVIGADIDDEKVKAINQASAPVIEPGLDIMIKKNKNRLSATTDFREPILKTDISFIVIPTPSKKDGSFSLNFIVDFAKKIGPFLKKKRTYHLFVLVSTVLPENSREIIIPAFEKYSQKKCGKHFGYCYSPSLIALGNVLSNLQNPDFLFLGSYDKKSGDILEKIYKKIYSPKTKIKRMSVESAELAKISLNSYVTMKITFANVLGELCPNITNADVDEVTRAIGEDKRIGPYYFKSGLGYGGPCFPRDNFAFANMAQKRGIKAPLALLIHKINESIPQKIVNLIKSFSLEKNTTIGILGLAYKTNTPIVEESQGLKIALALQKQKFPVIVFETLGYDYAKPVLKENVNYAKSLIDLLNKSNVIFIANPCKEFLPIAKLLKKQKKRKIVIDPWRLFKYEQFGKNIKYIPLGGRR